MGVLDDAIREHLALKRRQGASEEELKRQEAEALGPARREPPPRPAAEDRPDDELAGDVAGPDGTVAEAAAEPPAPPTHGDPLADEAADEVPADEALEEYGHEPIAGGREEADAIARGAPVGAADAEALEEDEQFMDEEELAEEELADELAGRDPGLAGDPGLELTDEPPPAPGEAPTQEQAPVLDSEVEGPGVVEAPEDQALVEEEQELAEAELAADETVLAEEDELVDAEEPAAAPDEAQEADDVLEDTPDFLRETPEDERLWFEQKPPRDFDLDR